MHDGDGLSAELCCEHHVLEDVGCHLMAAGTGPHVKHAPVRVDAQMREGDDHPLRAQEEPPDGHDRWEHGVWGHPGGAAEVRLTVLHDLNDIGCFHDPALLLQREGGMRHEDGRQ